MRQTPYFWNMEKILSYNDLPRCTEFVNYCQQFNRPILCSEWMARSTGNSSATIPGTPSQMANRSPLKKNRPSGSTTCSIPTIPPTAKTKSAS